MKEFIDVKKVNDIVLKANDSGWEVNTEAHDKGTSDYIYIRDIYQRLLQVALNVVDGSFYVYKPDSEKPIATHLSMDLDNEDWYVEILNMVYEQAKGCNKR